MHKSAVSGTREGTKDKSLNELGGGREKGREEEGRGGKRRGGEVCSGNSRQSEAWWPAWVYS